LTKKLLTINSEVRSLAKEELKIRPEGGEKVGRPLQLGNGSYLTEK